MRHLTLLAAAFLFAGNTFAQQPPPGGDDAKAALDASPRHGEWVDVQVPNRDQPIRSYVVYPERKEKAPSVIVIHEIYGLTDWIRAVADRLAAEGFIAIAPDLLSGKGPDAGGTDSLGSRDDVVRAIRGLTPGEVRAGLDAVRHYTVSLPAASGSVASMGFCWGGSTSFRYATDNASLGAAVVYYGSAPAAEELASISAPVLGLYGGDDARVNATIEATQSEMQRLELTYGVHIYEGAGHGFLRAQGGREGANLAAAGQAWPTTLEFLRAHLH